MASLLDIKPTMLEQEAEKVYWAIFRCPIPPVVKDRFMRASSQMNHASEATELGTYYNILESVNDLEALEIACRIKGDFSMLTKKFHIMVHIAETLPENQHYFLNRKISVFKAWAAILIGACLTALKLAKGLFLLRRSSNA